MGLVLVIRSQSPGQLVSSRRHHLPDWTDSHKGSAPLPRSGRAFLFSAIRRPKPFPVQSVATARESASSGLCIDWAWVTQDPTGIRFG